MFHISVEIKRVVAVSKRDMDGRECRNQEVDGINRQIDEKISELVGLFFAFQEKLNLAEGRIIVQCQREALAGFEDHELECGHGTLS